jgi:hypothetical protein
MVGVLAILGQPGVLLSDAPATAGTPAGGMRSPAASWTPSSGSGDAGAPLGSGSGDAGALLSAPARRAGAAAPRWGPPEPVAPRRASEDFARGQVAVHGRRVMAVWDAPLPGHPGTVLLRVSSRFPDGHWSRPVTMARVSAGFLGSYDLTLGPRGTALLTWSFGDEVGRVLERHRRGGSWSRPHRLNRGSGTSPVGTIDGRGAMTVAWTSYPFGSRTDVASRAPGVGWSQVRHLGRFGGDPSIAANRRGDVAVAWPTGDGVAVAIRRAGGTWQPARRLSSVLNSPDPPQLAVGPDGRVLVMWSRSEDEEEHFTRRHLAWARTRLDGTWTPVRYLDTRARVVYGTQPTMSMNARGDALAVWGTDMEHVFSAKAARFRFGAGWTNPVSLADSWGPAAVLTDSGVAVAVLGAGPHDTGPSWAYQLPGRSWHARRLSGRPLVTDTEAAGDRVALLYYGPRLSARLLRTGGG